MLQDWYRYDRPLLKYTYSDAVPKRLVTDFIYKVDEALRYKILYEKEGKEGKAEENGGGKEENAEGTGKTESEGKDRL